MMLTFQEFARHESAPLSDIHRAVLEFLQKREDAVVFGAYAVNAYVDAPRMTQDVDVLSTSAESLAEEIRAHLSRRFHFAVRVRELHEKRDFRIYQVSKPQNRHLVDIRSVATLPPFQRVAGVPVLTPIELIASKVVAWARRRGQPKSGTDWRDLAALLLAFPDLKAADGPVKERLVAEDVESDVMESWSALAAQVIRPEEETAEEW